MKLNIASGISNKKIQIFAATGGKEISSKLPLIIFLHGAGMDHTVWNLQTRYFAYHGYSVLSIDFPGHGRSEGPLMENIEQMADWIPELINVTAKIFGNTGASKSKLKMASLVGHSMGALVALECAARYPKLLTSISLLGVSATMPVHPVLLEAASNSGRSENNESLAYDLVTSWGHGRTGHFGISPVPGMSLIGGGRALLSSSPKAALGIGLKACNAYQNGMRAAKKVTCPTLCLMGSEDKMTPPKGLGKHRYAGNTWVDSEGEDRYRRAGSCSITSSKRGDWVRTRRDTSFSKLYPGWSIAIETWWCTGT